MCCIWDVICFDRDVVIWYHPVHVCTITLHTAPVRLLSIHARHLKTEQRYTVDRLTKNISIEWAPPCKSFTFTQIASPFSACRLHACVDVSSSYVWPNINTHRPNWSLQWTKTCTLNEIDNRVMIRLRVCNQSNNRAGREGISVSGILMCNTIHWMCSCYWRCVCIRININ